MNQTSQRRPSPTRFSFILHIFIHMLLPIGKVSLCSALIHIWVFLLLMPSLYWLIVLAKSLLETSHVILISPSLKTKGKFLSSFKLLFRTLLPKRIMHSPFLLFCLASLVLGLLLHLSTMHEITLIFSKSAT